MVLDKLSRIVFVGAAVSAIEQVASFGMEVVPEHFSFTGWDCSRETYAEVWWDVLVVELLEVKVAVVSCLVQAWAFPDEVLQVGILFMAVWALAVDGVGDVS